MNITKKHFLSSLFKLKKNGLSVTNFSDRDGDCLSFEALGEYDELFFADGESQSRNWRTTGTSFVTRYPRAWERYLTRPIAYLQHGSG